MNKQKLSAIIMVPVVAIAMFIAWKSYKASNPPDTVANPVSSKNGMSSGGGGGGAPGGGGAGGGQQRGPTTEQMVDTMAKDLTLNADQKAKILTIEQDLAAKRKAMPKEMSREDRRKQSTANRAAAETQIKTILTPDQAKKYDTMQAERRAKMAAMRAQGGGGGGGGKGGGGGMQGAAGPGAAPGGAPAKAGQ